MSGLAKSAVTAYSDLRQLPPEVKSFLLENTRDQFCLSEFWFDLLLRYSPAEGQTSRIYVVTAERSGDVECVLVAASTAGTGARNGARKLVSLTNFYTISYAPIVRGDRGNSTTAIEDLAIALLQERPTWDVIELRSLIQESTTTTDLMQAFRRAGLLTDTYQQFENWYQPLSDVSAEEYFRTRPSRLRNTLARKWKKARKDHKVDFTIYRTPENLPKGLEHYQTIYARSWKEPETYPEFIPQLLRECAERGILRLGVLYIDQDPAAAQIWLVTGARATIYKLAYDEKYTQLSVGSILTKLMFDQAINADRVSEVDYGVGSEPYKLDWMSNRRHIVGLIGFNPRSARGLLAAARHFAGRYIRRGVRRLDPSAKERLRERASAGNNRHGGAVIHAVKEGLRERD